MNTIRQSLHMVEDSGLKINTEEEEFEEYIQLTIRILNRKKLMSITRQLFVFLSFNS